MSSNSGQFVLLDTGGTGNGYIRVTATGNITPQPISGTITLSAPGVSDFVINITQYNSAVMLESNSVSVDCLAHANTLSLTALTDFEVIIEDNTWLTTSILSGTSLNNSITLNIAKNTTPSARTQNVAFKSVFLGETSYVYVTISQEASNLTATLSQTTFYPAGGNATLTISGDCDWTVSVPSWMTIDDEDRTGHGYKEINVHVGFNLVSTKYGVVSVYNTDDPEFAVNISVSQTFITVSVQYELEWLDEPQAEIYPSSEYTYKVNLHTLIVDLTGATFCVGAGYDINVAVFGTSTYGEILTLGTISTNGGTLTTTSAETQYIDIEANPVLGEYYFTSGSELQSIRLETSITANSSRGQGGAIVGYYGTAIINQIDL